jgi:hypothetical protein
MKNKLFLVAMAACVPAVGLVLIGCKDNDDGGGGGSAAVTIKITGLTAGTTYYVGPVWEAGGGWSASGYETKSAVADDKGVNHQAYFRRHP